MEFPDLGKHCSESFCHQIDFLPVKCDACKNTFCTDHYTYSQHNCPSAYKKDVQVPVCPLCNAPVPIKRGDIPDVAVGLHIDNDCASDPAVKKRKIYTNRCSKKGCKVKELIKVTCDSCMLDFCLTHRHGRDHDCQGPSAQPAATRAGLAAMQRLQTTTKMGGSSSGSASQWSGNTNLNNPGRQVHAVQSTSNAAHLTLQGNISEDEALARAMQASLSQSSNLNQEEIDRQIAAALAASDGTQGHPQRSRRTLSSCSLS